MIPDPTDPTCTVIVPGFMTEAQFTDPSFCAFVDVGPICTLFVPSLNIGGFWLPEPRLWMLQAPVKSLEEHILHCQRYLVASGQMSEAIRYCEAAGKLGHLH